MLLYRVLFLLVFPNILFAQSYHFMVEEEQVRVPYGFDYKATIKIVCEACPAFQVESIETDKGEIQKIADNFFQLRLPTKKEYTQEDKNTYTLTANLLTEGTSKQLKEEKSFYAVMPHLNVNYLGVNTLMRHCGNIVDISSPLFEESALLIENEYNAEIAVCNTGGNLLVPDSLGTASLRISAKKEDTTVALGKLQFRVVDAPLPTVVFYAGNKKLQNGDTISLAIPLKLQLIPDKYFSEFYPNEQTYGIKRIALYESCNGEVPTFLSYFPLKDTITWYDKVSETKENEPFVEIEEGDDELEELTLEEEWAAEDEFGLEDEEKPRAISPAKQGKNTHANDLTGIKILVPPSACEGNRIIIIKLKDLYRKNFQGKVNKTADFSQNFLFFMEGE